MPSAVSAIVEGIDEARASAGGLAPDPADRGKPGAGVGASLRECGRRSLIRVMHGGRRHSQVVMFALVQAAIVAGVTSYAAIRHWIGAAPGQVLEEVGARWDRRTGRLVAPHPDTLCRTMDGRSYRGRYRPRSNDVRMRPAWPFPSIGCLMKRLASRLLRGGVSPRLRHERCLDAGMIVAAFVILYLGFVVGMSRSLPLCSAHRA